MICNGCHKRFNILSPSGFCEQCLIECQVLLEHEVYIRILLSSMEKDKARNSPRPVNEADIPGFPSRPSKTPLLEQETPESKKWKRLLEVFQRDGS